MPAFFCAPPSRTRGESARNIANTLHLGRTCQHTGRRGNPFTHCAVKNARGRTHARVFEKRRSCQSFYFNDPEVLRISLEALYERMTTRRSFFSRVLTEVAAGRRDDQKWHVHLYNFVGTCRAIANELKRNTMEFQIAGPFQSLDQAVPADASIAKRLGEASPLAAGHIKSRTYRTQHESVLL